MNSGTTLRDILIAKKLIDKHLSKTPLHHYPALDTLTGAEVYVKHENYQPIGAFKVRGGINLIFNLSSQEKRAGVITASTGNHGQSIAYAARLFDIRASIVVPEGANPVKIQAMESLGARIIFFGRDFDDAKTQAKHLAESEGLRFISSGDEPLLIAGVGTYTLEIFEELPEVEVIIVPVGGGSGASGTCIAAKSIDPEVEIIGVQAEAAPSAYLTWKNKRATEAQMETAAEGLATRAPFMLPQKILWKYLDDFILVSEEEMRKGVRLYLEKAKTLSELAGASPLAAALRLKERIKGKKVVLILSGGNIAPDKLRAILD
jgi:threonine dehydratase